MLLLNEVASVAASGEEIEGKKRMKVSLYLNVCV